MNEDLPPPPTQGAPDCGPPSGNRVVLALTQQDGVDWIKEIKDFLVSGTLPEDDAEAERIARRAKSYCIIDTDLYQRRPNDVALRCVSTEEGVELLTDIHAGECGHHSSSRTLVGKAFRSGFYWPTALQDATQLVKTREA